MSEVKYWSTGALGEYLREAVDFRIYVLPNPDWSGLADDARRYGLSESEVQEFLWSVREEG